MVTFDISSIFKGMNRVVIVGIGSEFRGDDAAGVLVARNLKKNLKSPNVLIIEAGVAPENFTSEIRKFKPSHIFLVDAADFKAKPGTIRLFKDLSAAIGQSISTHKLSLSMLSDYLRNQTSAEVLLVGIQPVVAEIGGEMCKEVKDAVDEVAKALAKNMRSL
jgi:hydrogenase 3 maturation protease